MRETYRFKEPDSLKEYREEVLARLGVLKRKGVDINIPGLLESSRVSGIWSENEISREEQRLLSTLNFVKQIEEVVSSYLTRESASENIDDKLDGVRNSIKKILSKDEIPSWKKSLCESILHNLNNLKLSDLSRLEEILNKLENDQPLDNTETSLIRLWASNSSPEEKKEGEEGKKEEGKKEGEEGGEGGENFEFLSFDKARKQLLLAQREFLEKYKAYWGVIYEIKKRGFDEIEAKKKLEEFGVYLLNAEISYKKALDEYKLASINDFVERKKKYIAEIVIRTKAKRIKEKLRKSNPEASESEIDNLVRIEARKEAEIIFKKEKKEIMKEIISYVAYDILEIEEKLEREKLNIRREIAIEKAGNLGRLWERYKNLPYSRKVMIGAILAGVGAGTFAVTGGMGFAALGVGTVAALRRFFGGGVVGGLIKRTSEYFIKKGEERELGGKTDKEVERISSEISEVLANPETEPRGYGKWLEMAQSLDARIDNLLRERENIRSKSDKKRRSWTLVAILVGGITANIDNIASLVGVGKRAVVEAEEAASFSGSGIDSSIVSAEEGVSKEVLGVVDETKNVTDVSGEAMSVLPDKNLPLTEGSVPVGKGGFWEAALGLKRTLGISNEDFATAWKNSVVVDSATGEEIPISQAHWVRIFRGNLFLGYDLTKKVFSVISGEGVEIGDADKLIEAWRRVVGGKDRIPLRVLLSLIRGGSKI